MNVNFGAAVFAASLFAVATAQAATVTAVFDGTVETATGDFTAANGQSLTATIVGEDDAPEISVSSVPSYASNAAQVAAYQLTSISVGISSIGIGTTIINPIMFIGNDSPGFTTDLVDIIGVTGFNSATTESIDFIAFFAGNTLASTSLADAIALGIAQASTLFETVTYSAFGPSGTGAGLVVANTGITEILFEEPDTENGGGQTGGGGQAGGGGGGVDGGGTDLSVIPLPAAGWMLLAALGGLGAMRRRRSA